MFPEARCRRLPLRTAIANVPDSKPTVPARMWRIKSGSRMLPRPFRIDRFNKEGSLAAKQSLHPCLEKAVSFDTHLHFSLAWERNEGAIGGPPRGNPIPLALRNMRLRSLVNSSYCGTRIKPTGGPPPALY